MVPPDEVTRVHGIRCAKAERALFDEMRLRQLDAREMAVAAGSATAQETIKIGLILPMTGPFTTTGKQVEAGVRFYLQQNGATVAGRKKALGSSAPSELVPLGWSASWNMHHACRPIGVPLRSG